MDSMVPRGAHSSHLTRHTFKLKTKMTSHLYRFRSIDRLLGSSKELERQEIYFASPEQLNDPLEGRKNIYWQGDLIVWENLFRHYLMCLLHAYGLVGLRSMEESPEWNEIPLRDPYGNAHHPVIKELHDRIFDAFFSNPAVAAYVRSLAASQHRVRQTELGVHLHHLHPIALISIDMIMNQRDGDSETPRKFETQLADLTKHLLHIASTLDKTPSACNGDENLIDAVYAAQQNAISQMDLIRLYNREINPEEKGRVFIGCDFPMGYLRQLESLMHRPWYAACFMQHCSDSSMWGYYGSSHAGVCLKFKARQIDDRLVLRLRTLNGENSAGRIYSKLDHQFYPVTYDATHVEINFFRTLGSLPIPIANRQWYTDRNGNRSICIPYESGGEQEFRDKYWRDFNTAATTKTKAWEPESEYRLVLHSMLFDLTTEDRKLQYDFDDLDGIIFGIRTSLDDKLKISKVIEDKCKALGRKDFKFYQAQFSRQTGKIEYSPMSLLKFN
ncbi:DUF2971 domain-containing protein [Burkholderia contaminans]|uniref:DUF2971 domain-containing protein n=2 Tax=Burkholderia contaminans TaxID=488447 RepID=A0A3N8PDL4_9BURK|nr:DUF2971 domain-containing protein [Burkholderia contaminans]